MDGSPRVFPGWKSALTLTAAFVVTSLAVFSPAIGGGFLSWDDELLVTRNDNLRQINATTLKNIFTTYDPELYIPLTFVSYQVDTAVGGGGPAVFHVHNVVLHAINALLVVWLLWVLLDAGWIAAACGLLFLLHPLNAEAASWISARPACSPSECPLPWHPA